MIGEEVDLSYPLTPVNCAVMLCAPTLSVEIIKVAIAVVVEPLTSDEPMEVAPS